MQRIILPPSREEFKTCLESKHFYPEAVDMTMLAWDWCGEWHAGQPREDGSEYCDHPRAAAWILLQETAVTDPETITLACLHDVGEVRHRTPPTHAEICRAFSYRIAYKLEALTKYPGQDVLEYTHQVFAGGTKVLIAKFADRLHNLRTLSACSRDKQDRVMSDTWVYYYPDAGIYQDFFPTMSPKDGKIISRLWGLMEEAMNELQATR